MGPHAKRMGIRLGEMVTIENDHRASAELCDLGHRGVREVGGDWTGREGGNGQIRTITEHRAGSVICGIRSCRAAGRYSPRQECNDRDMSITITE